MKKVLFCIVSLFFVMIANAQNDEEWLYYQWTGFEELLPGKPFTYRYVEAMDDASENFLNDLYASMKDAGDNSIIKRSKGGWYVKNNYSLPEGNYYESAFHKKYLHEDNGIIYIIRPVVTITLRKGCQIDGLLEYFGDKVTLDKSQSYGGSPTQYWLTFHMSTSKEVLEAISQWYDIDQSSIITMRPKTYELYVDYDSHLISVLNDSNGENDEYDRNLITEMDWEGVWPGIYDASNLESTDEGLAITNSQLWEHPYDGGMTGIAHRFPLVQGHDYIIRISLKVPSDGTYWLDMCSWDSWDSGSNYPCEIPVTASDDFQVIEVECPDYFPKGTKGEEYQNCMVMLGCGQVVGTTIVKKVEVYEVNNSNAKETGITAVHACQKADNAIYNLAGQKVSSSYKGIVIQNGKKVVMK